MKGGDSHLPIWGTDILFSSLNNVPATWHVSEGRVVLLKQMLAWEAITDDMEKLLHKVRRKKI